MISLLLCLLPSAALFIAEDLSIWFFFLSASNASEATQGTLNRLERWSEYWCLPLSPKKCEASFLINPHQANLQPNVFLFNSLLCFNPTPTFLGVTFDCTLFFSKHVPSRKTKFCIKLLFGPFSLMFHPDGFLS